MNIQEKLKILADSAKYDVSCSSSGSDRQNIKGGLGNAELGGICHSFAADGRCISLLKVLMTNICIYDCKYCVNRCSNNVERAVFTPEEIADLTINFYKRNYIEGLFLSSGIIKNPDYTMERLYEGVSLLRNKYKFNGYIHVKTIPGASDYLVKKLGLLVDRMSINIELPSNDSLKLLAPNKEKDNITKPMKFITRTKKESKKFVPAGQSTQMIIGATPDTDLKIMTLSENLYEKMEMKRVYYSAYISVNKDNLLPALKEPPLKRENRLYQADWLLRFYNFKVSDLLDDVHPSFIPELDPKASWAIQHLNLFPVEINKCDYNTLLKIPGVGVLSARKIIMARRNNKLTFEALKKMGVVLKRAKYFILCDGKYFTSCNIFNEKTIHNQLILEDKMLTYENKEQLSLFEASKGDTLKCITGEF